MVSIYCSGCRVDVSPTEIYQKIGIYYLGLGWFGQGRNRQKGMQHQRIFGRGHIGRGRTNIASCTEVVVSVGIDLEQVREYALN